MFDLRKVKLFYFFIIFNEVKFLSVYWNFFKRVINFKVCKNIGFFKKDDSILEFMDLGKVNLMNFYFVMIGLKLFNILFLFISCGYGIIYVDMGEMDIF